MARVIAKLPYWDGEYILLDDSTVLFESPSGRCVIEKNAEILETLKSQLETIGWRIIK